MVRAEAKAAIGAEPKEVRVQLDGQVLDLNPKAFIENDRTLVPMRAIFGALGATITWDDTTKTVTGTRGTTTLKLTIASTTAWVNDHQVTSDVPARIVDGRTFVPARFVAEVLGAKVDFDSNTNTVLITTDGVVSVQPAQTVDLQVTDEVVNGEINVGGEAAPPPGKQVREISPEAVKNADHEGQRSASGQ